MLTGAGVETKGEYEFEDASFIPNHDTSACLAVECSGQVLFEHFRHFHNLSQKQQAPVPTSLKHAGGIKFSAGKHFKSMKSNEVKH